MGLFRRNPDKMVSFEGNKGTILKLISNHVDDRGMCCTHTKNLALKFKKLEKGQQLKYKDVHKGATIIVQRTK